MPLIQPTELPPQIAPPFFGPRGDHDESVWGIRNGIFVGLYPGAVGYDDRGGAGGPRGLIRIGYEEEGKLYFINFLAVSPVARNGQRGMSELDDSPTDHRPGIIMKAYPPAFHENINAWQRRLPPPLPECAEVRRAPDGVRELQFVIRYERFPNGAIAYLLVTIREDRPHEVVMQPYEEPGSAPLISYFISGTWGNLTRLRDVYLRGRIANAKALWPHYRGREFAPPVLFSLEEIPRNRAGDLVFAARPDETQPWDVPGYPEPQRLTQYYRKPARTFSAEIKGLVNGRLYFWKSYAPVHGGIAFENVGLVDEFQPGSPLIFGYDAGDPEHLFE